ncbi:hypothetical protein L1987_44302 [Smallanthus sonchifolius]|uniref:Uncharacterized protein n=1 Tax=Smallanthus sonchifolius TaxID=185202 RepID=A0ACB9GNX2_9ASTR|nr:hypothetical protein L1987_44302 [Smallanthus sonchifolius]
MKGPFQPTLTSPTQGLKLLILVLKTRKLKMKKPSRPSVEEKQAQDEDIGLNNPEAADHDVFNDTIDSNGPNDNFQNQFEPRVWAFESLLLEL